MSAKSGSSKRSKLVSDIIVNGALAFICLLWSIPTVGLLVSSFRDRQDILTTGWWTIFPHREWMYVGEIEPPTDQDRNGVMNIEGATQWYKKIWSLDIQDMSWVEHTAHEVGFAEHVLDLQGEGRIEVCRSVRLLAITTPAYQPQMTC